MSNRKDLEQRKVLGLNQRGAGVIVGIVSLLVGFILFVLAFRFVLRLIGASPDSAFVSWIYNVSQPFDAPFFGMFHTDTVLTTGRVEWETLVALLAYGIAGSFVLSALSWGSHRHHPVA